MAKDPAFLFYSSDFLAGVQELTMEERGQYITLLCLQHQKGHLSEKIISLAAAYATADVMAKFRQDPAGLWYNERLDEEIEKRKVHSSKQRDRAKEGWKKRKNDAAAYTTADAAALPLEDENVNENKNGFNEGGMGETYKLPTKPTERDVGLEIPTQKMDLAKQMFFTTTRTMLTDEQANSFWQVFKGVHFTGNNFYQNAGKVYSHFIQWIKLQKVSNGTQSTAGNGGTGQQPTGSARDRQTSAAAAVSSDLQATLKLLKGGFRSDTS